MMMMIACGDSLKILETDFANPRISLIVGCIGLNHGTCCGQSILDNI